VIGSVIVPSRRLVGGPAAPRYHALAHPEEPDAMMTLTLATVYLLPLGPAAEPGYPNPKLLVEPEELAKAPEKYHVLDVRGKEDYRAGHVPGAVWAEAGRWSKAVTAGKADDEFWTAELGLLGLTPDKPTVVVSDDVRYAARTWWMLSLAGVPDVRLLNGGWVAYTAAKLPTTDGSPVISTTLPRWKSAPGRQAAKEDVLGIARKKRPGRVIDARSREEYEAGHVPGAVRLEWSELLDPKTQKFKPAAELAKLLKERNIDPAEESCSY
jgi:thiosulfate/3-mercaptopyruvate sulfurtransferase